ncbi:MAG: tRNA (guanosine(37)-N1)-methyltransferase TrmD [Pseudomonadota bacterium]
MSAPSKPASDQTDHEPLPPSAQPWRAVVLTLFPELFPGPLATSVVGKALDNGLWQLDTIPIRDYGLGRHHSVDDTPAGGGPGMVMRADVVAAAIDAARTLHPPDSTPLPLICLSPRGERLDQDLVHELADGPGVMLLSGRFEGVDERVLQGREAREISIGDYVLSGGEMAAYVLIDACVRLHRGVLGADESLAQESFENGLLEYPQYTRPRIWEGREIPDVLLSGDHQRINAWREAQARTLTRCRRPDMLDAQETKIADPNRPGKTKDT